MLARTWEKLEFWLDVLCVILDVHTELR
jgi:hypothetical protein